jgi:hypothetical protein
MEWGIAARLDYSRLLGRLSAGAVLKKSDERRRSTMNKGGGGA